MKPRILSTARLSFPLATALAVLLATQSVSADTIYWDGGTASWVAGTLTPWSTVAGATTPDPLAVPGALDDVIFNITGVNTANIVSLANSTRAANSLAFNSTGSSNFRAGGSSSVSSSLTIGAGGITVNSLAGAVTIGQTPTSFGTITTVLSAAQTWANNGVGTLTLTGGVTNGANLLTIDGSAATTISGIIGNGAGGVTKNGGGTLLLQGANTYTGATIANGGILAIQNYSALDTTSGITVAGGSAILEIRVVGTGGTSDAISKNLSLHGTMRTGGGTSSNTLALTWNGDITLAGASTINNHGNGSIDINGQVDLGANALTFKADQAGSRIDGNIIGTGGSLIKTGTQALFIAGTSNSYTGTTTISAGRLQFVNQASLYNNNAVPSAGTGWTAANINVQSTGTLAFNVGGAGQFTTADVSTLLTNLAVSTGPTDGMNAGSSFGFDTTNAPLISTIPTFTIADVIADSTGAGGGARGLTKLGTGTLILTNINTYSGPTTISGGTLKLANPGALGASASASVGSGTTLQLATAGAFSGSALSLSGGTILSDQASPGLGLTHVFGATAVANATHNFTGANATDGKAGIQIGNVTNSSGANGSVTFNPTTANLTIAGGYTGAVNGGVNGLILSGSAATNSLTGDITLGTRTNINVTKSGNSVWTLSGTNNAALAGTLTVSGGALIATKLAALPNSGAVTISGGTLGVQVEVGMSGGWTTAEVDALLAAVTTIKTSGALGIDTTNGNLTQWTDFTTTNLGVALGITKLGANTLTLNSAGNNYAGETLISQGTLKLDVDHTLSAATNNLIFGFPNGTTSATGILDLNNVNATFGGNLQVNGNSTTPYEIQIDSGKSLTVNGAVQIGASGPGVDETVTKLAVTGGGEFIHNGTTFLVGGSTSASLTQYSTLDLSGLSKATITTSGNFRVAPNTGTNIGGQATLLLPIPAVADTVTTTTINVGAAATRGLSIGNGGSLFNKVPDFMNTLQLGTGLTTINTPFVNIASNPISGNLRDVGQLIYGQAAGDLKIRGADGSSRAGEINLGVINTVASQTTASSALTVPVLFDTSGHDADILVTSLNVGLNFNRAGSQEHVFKFGEQTTGVGVGSLASKLDATNVNIGTRAAGNSSTGTQSWKMDISGGTVLFGNVGATGTGVSIGNSAYDQAGAATFDSQLNISGGNVTIHEGTGFFAVRLGNSTAANGGIVNASMNLTGGTTTLKGDIHKGTGVGGTVNSTLKLAGGTLDMDNHDIGTASELITLTAESGTLQNVATINGTGGLTKTTAGPLIVSGTIAYTGDTTVSEGTLRQSSVNTANDASTVTIAATATLDLTYTGTDTVDKLFIGGVQQPAGIYGPTATPLAQITNSSGTGTLTVLSNPPAGYSSWASLNGASLTNLSEDHDNDGVDNGTEYFIGGPTGNTTGFTPLPGVTNTAGVLSVTWTKAANYTGTYGTDFVVETSATLTGVWATEPSPGTVAISGTTVTYTFPAGTKNFARLKVTGP